MSNPDSVHSTNSSAGATAPIFAALGDSTRLELVTRLSDGGTHSISKLCKGLGQSRQGVTKHLRVLEQAGVVISNKTGRENQFVLLPESLLRMQSYLQLVSTQWDEALERLKDFVESQQ